MSTSDAHDLPADLVQLQQMRDGLMYEWKPNPNHAFATPREPRVVRQQDGQRVWDLLRIRPDRRWSLKIPDVTEHLASERVRADIENVAFVAGAIAASEAFEGRENTARRDLVKQASASRAKRWVVRWLHYSEQAASNLEAMMETCNDPGRSKATASFEEWKTTTLLPLLDTAPKWLDVDAAARRSFTKGFARRNSEIKSTLDHFLIRARSMQPKNFYIDGRGRQRRYNNVHFLGSDNARSIVDNLPDTFVDSRFDKRRAEGLEAVTKTITNAVRLQQYMDAGGEEKFFELVAQLPPSLREQFQNDIDADHLIGAHVYPKPEHRSDVLDHWATPTDLKRLAAEDAAAFREAASRPPVERGPFAYFSGPAGGL